MREALTLLVGAAAGYLAYTVGMPLPWMLGPMIAATTISSFQFRLVVPSFLPVIALPIIGVMLGSRFTVELFRQIPEFAVTLLFLGPFVICGCWVSFTFYRRVAGFDPVSAYYSSMPGGLNDMMILGAAAGGDERRIALAHAARILCVISFVALFFGLVLGVRSGGTGAGWLSFGEVGWLPMAWLVAAALAGIPLGKVLHLPAPQMLGPMIVSAVIHLAGFVEVPPPSLAVICAQIVLGLRIGSRFLGVEQRFILQQIGLGVVSSLLLLLVAVTFAWLVTQLTGMPVSQVFLAYSPGGFVEMSLLALALGQEVAYVTVAHVLRILMVVFGAPLAFRLIGVQKNE